MIKERCFSPRNDFRTGSVAKTTFAISLILIVIIFIEVTFNITILLDASILFALILLFLAATAIFWFFHRQYSKLSRIVSEIEEENMEKE